jgi:hypothetical protein
MLDSAIRKSNRVGSNDIANSISRLGSIEVRLGVVILDSILVGVGLPWLSIGRSRGIGRLGSIGRGRNWQGSRSRGICWGRRRRRGNWSICWGRNNYRNGNWSWCNMNWGMGVGMGMGMVTAVRSGTNHSHQGRQHNNLETGNN